MSEERFKELVSLFLDNEISPEDLAELEGEISANRERREHFTRSCRIDHAMRVALRSQSGSNRSRTPISVSALVFGGAIAAAFVFGTAMVPAVERLINHPGDAEFAVTGHETFTENSFLLRRGVVENRSVWLMQVPRMTRDETDRPSVNLAGFGGSQPDVRSWSEWIPGPAAGVEVLSVGEFSVQDLLNLAPQRTSRERPEGYERIPEPAVEATLISLGPGGL